MDTVNIKLYQEELEELTGKIFAGDLTPLVYELLKKSSEKEKLILALGGKLKKKPKPVETVKQSFVSFDALFANGLEVR